MKLKKKICKHVKVYKYDDEHLVLHTKNYDDCGEQINENLREYHFYLDKKAQKKLYDILGVMLNNEIK